MSGPQLWRGWRRKGRLPVTENVALAMRWRTGGDEAETRRRVAEALERPPDVCDLVDRHGVPFAIFNVDLR